VWSLTSESQTVLCFSLSVLPLSLPESTAVMVWVTQVQQDLGGADQVNQGTNIVCTPCFFGLGSTPTIYSPGHFLRGETAGNTAV